MVEIVMSRHGRRAWNAMYDVLENHELTSEAYLMKIEILNLLDKAIPNAAGLEKAIMLLIIADSNMRDLVENKNR